MENVNDRRYVTLVKSLLKFNSDPEQLQTFKQYFIEEMQQIGDAGLEKEVKAMEQILIAHSNAPEKRGKFGITLAPKLSWCVCSYCSP